MSRMSATMILAPMRRAIVVSLVVVRSMSEAAVSASGRSRGLAFLGMVLRNLSGSGQFDRPTPMQFRANLAYEKEAPMDVYVSCERVVREGSMDVFNGMGLRTVGRRLDEVDVPLDPDDADTIHVDHVMTDSLDSRDSNDESITGVLLEDLQVEEMIAGASRADRRYNHEDVAVVQVVQQENVVNTCKMITTIPGILNVVTNAKGEAFLRCPATEKSHCQSYSVAGFDCGQKKLVIVGNPDAWPALAGNLFTARACVMAKMPGACREMPK